VTPPTIFSIKLLQAVLILALLLYESAVEAAAVS
jgi:hypothetical protein